MKLAFILRQSSQTLQRVFKEKWISACGKEWKDGEDNHVLISNPEITKTNILSSDQIQVIKEREIADWDITLVGTLLLKLSFLSTDHGNHHLIARLKEIRNQIMHNTSLKINKTDFEYIWKEIEEILTSLGEDRNTIVLLKSKCKLIIL